MKKLITAAFLIAAFAAVSYAQSNPVKLSLYDQIAWPKTDSANVVLGLVDNNTQEVYGADLNLISARAEVMHGFQWAFIYNRANEMTGVHGALYTVAQEVTGMQWGFVNVADEVKGVQWGFVNLSKDNLLGVQLGLVNIAQEAQGVQFGFFNQAQRFSGLQLGFVNNIKTIDKGLQIGLVNLIQNNGYFPGMILVNGRF